MHSDEPPHRVLWSPWLHWCNTWHGCGDQSCILSGILACICRLAKQHACCTYVQQVCAGQCVLYTSCCRCWGLHMDGAPLHLYRRYQKLLAACSPVRLLDLRDMQKQVRCTRGGGQGHRWGSNAQQGQLQPVEQCITVLLQAVPHIVW